MAKKEMSGSIRRSAQTGRFVPSERSKGKERLVDSIAGSLRVEGYAVKRETIVHAVEKAIKQSKK